MSTRTKFLFFTLVVLACVTGSRNVFAAQPPPTPDLNEPAAPAKAPKVFDETRSGDTVDISKPPPSVKSWPPPADAADFFYAYRKSLGVRVGASNSSSVNNNVTTPFLTGVQYSATDDERRVFEFGADLLSDGTGDLQVSRRWIYSRTQFRPYLRAGVGLLVNPQDQLATLIKYQNYRIVGAGGFELTIRKESSIRLEIEASLSGSGLQEDATVGYVWAF